LSRVALEAVDDVLVAQDHHGLGPAQMAMTVRVSTPARRRKVAALWRASWRRASRTPASARRSFQARQSRRGD
jgi:hypothetical protein